MVGEMVGLCSNELETYHSMLQNTDVSKNRTILNPPKWMVKIMVPLFLQTPFLFEGMFHVGSF